VSDLAHHPGLTDEQAEQAVALALARHRIRTDGGSPPHSVRLVRAGVSGKAGVPPAARPTAVGGTLGGTQNGMHKSAVLRAFSGVLAGPILRHYPLCEQSLRPRPDPGPVGLMRTWPRQPAVTGLYDVRRAEGSCDDNIHLSSVMTAGRWRTLRVIVAPGTDNGGG
jgi:hypothetical protein